jgi:hypothetical protein
VLPSFLDESLQGVLGEWWSSTPDRAVKRGRLLHAFVPTVDENPNTLRVQGRPEGDPGDHRTATCTVEPLYASSPPRRSGLPVAGLPQYEGETFVIARAKRRPVLVLGEVHPRVDRSLRGTTSTRWQTAPTLLVAPYYGAAPSEKRAGWPTAFVERIVRCEYPQYLHDHLPGPSGQASILRLDHALPIGAGSASIEVTEYCLTDAALAALDEWLDWLVKGRLPNGGAIASVRELLMSGA